MASKSGSKPRSPRSFARRGIISSLQNYVIAKVLLKAMWGETERLMLLSCSVFFVGGRVVRQGRWKGSEVGRQGGRVVSWECGKGGRVMRWQGGKGGRMVRQKGRRYLVLFKDGGHEMSPRFHLFVSNVNQGNKGVGWVQDFLAWPQGWKYSP